MGLQQPLRQEMGEIWEDSNRLSVASQVETIQAREAEIILFDGAVRAQAIASAEASVDEAFAAIDAAKHEQAAVTMNARSDNNDL